MSQNKTAEESITNKKRFWEIFPTVLTVISTLIVSYIGININGHISREELDFKKQANETESKFRKIEILEKLTPGLVDKDSIQNEIAIVNMYILDTALALRYAEIINTSGTQGAMKLLFKSTFNNNDTISKRRVEELLFNSEVGKNLVVSNVESSSKIALRNAFDELKAIEGKTKYLDSLGLDKSADWSVAFVLWCYLNTNLKKQILAIKTSSLSDFVRQLYQNKQLFDYPIKKNYETMKPRPGDIVFFDFGQNQGPQICGILYNFDNEFVYTIEGNTNEGNIDGRAKKKVRYLADVQCFARIQ
jgi:hypothetical protein